MVVGISQPVGTRWFREAGGMAPSHLSRSSKPLQLRPGVDDEAGQAQLGTP